MLPIVSAQKAQQIVNGQQLPQPKRVEVRKDTRGRDLADNAIRLRVYLATRLRLVGESSRLDAEHWGPAAVTALAIALEKSGVRGIPEDSDCDVVV